MISMTAFVGTAGWTVPNALSEQFAEEGSHLERYASRLNAVEINSSFYRPHRRLTYERWAASVPDSFRFAVKMPKTITHQRRLFDCAELLSRFADEISGLGGKRGPILVQLPPSLAFESVCAGRFFAMATAMLGGTIVCEPRHQSWFSEEAEVLCMEHGIARVVADPPAVDGNTQPSSWQGVCYFRLHGAPRIYVSDYPPARIERQAALVRDLLALGREVWTIFDNTAAGHAPANALALTRNLT